MRSLRPLLLVLLLVGLELRNVLACARYTDAGQVQSI